VRGACPIHRARGLVRDHEHRTDVHRGQSVRIQLRCHPGVAHDQRIGTHGTAPHQVAPPGGDQVLQARGERPGSGTQRARQMDERGAVAGIVLGEEFLGDAGRRPAGQPGVGCDDDVVVRCGHRGLLGSGRLVGGGR
jgi:hypothetical protein